MPTAMTLDCMGLHLVSEMSDKGLHMPLYHGLRHRHQLRFADVSSLAAFVLPSRVRGKIVGLTCQETYQVSSRGDLFRGSRSLSDLSLAQKKECDSRLLADLELVQDLRPSYTHAVILATVCGFCCQW